MRPKCDSRPSGNREVFNLVQQLRHVPGGILIRGAVELVNRVQYHKAIVAAFDACLYLRKDGVGIGRLSAQVPDVEQSRFNSDSHCPGDFAQPLSEESGLNLEVQEQNRTLDG